MRAARPDSGALASANSTFQASCIPCYLSVRGELQEVRVCFTKDPRAESVAFGSGAGAVPLRRPFLRSAIRNKRLSALTAITGNRRQSSAGSVEDPRSFPSGHHWRSPLCSCQQQIDQEVRRPCPSAYPRRESRPLPSIGKLNVASVPARITSARSRHTGHALTRQHKSEHHHQLSRKRQMHTRRLQATKMAASERYSVDRIQIEAVPGGQHEGDNVPRHTEALHILQRQRQRSFTRRRGERDQERRAHEMDEAPERNLHDPDHRAEHHLHQTK